MVAEVAGGGEKRRATIFVAAVSRQRLCFRQRRVDRRPVLRIQLEAERLHIVPAVVALAEPRADDRRRRRRDDRASSASRHWRAKRRACRRLSRARTKCPETHSSRRSRRRTVCTWICSNRRFRRPTARVGRPSVRRSARPPGFHKPAAAPRVRDRTRSSRPRRADRAARRKPGWRRSGRRASPARANAPCRNW